MKQATRATTRSMTRPRTGAGLSLSLLAPGQVVRSPETDEEYAVEHLNKAREFANESEYQNASDMADVAEEYGNRARDIARRRGHESGR